MFSRFHFSSVQFSYERLSEFQQLHHSDIGETLCLFMLVICPTKLPRTT